MAESETVYLLGLPCLHLARHCKVFQNKKVPDGRDREQIKYIGSSDVLE